MTGYARRLGLFSGTMAVVGGIIGGGIFRTPASVAERAGSFGLTLAVWITGGVVALAGAFCFGELGARRPRAGGGYVYLRETFGPLPAFLYGWTLLLVIATGAIAAVAVLFADYALALLGLPEGWTLPVAVASVVVLSGINYLGVRPGALTQNLFTVLKLLALALLVGVGLAWAAPAVAAAPEPAAPRNAIVAFGAALVPVLFTYGGWQQTNFIAEEIVEPERTLPRALVLGVVIVVAVYLSANLAYLRVLGLGGLAASTAPAAEVMERLLGPRGAGVIAAGIAVSSFGFLNLVILVTPRVLQAMAADGVFLPRLARLHPVYQTPTAAILLQACWAILLILSGSFAQLVDYVTFGDWIFFGLTVAGLFVYRRRDRGAPATGFRTPGYPFTPALFVFAAGYVVVSAIAANPRNAALGTLLIALGVPVYAYWARRARLARASHG
ncbi:MAG TPA: amino acid permease [Gemmatimonadales bacterium]|nr:amino acid permease [Gemmatimonadales bacterium]